METKEDLTYKLLCTVCLCVGRTTRVITDEKLKRYYKDALSEIPLYNITSTGPIVCWECEALLQKAVLFREQVQDSYRILQTYTNENLHECLLSDVSRPPRLKVITNQPISIIPTPDDDDDEKFEMQRVFVKDEVKDDWDDNDMADTTNPDDPQSDSCNNADEMLIEAELKTIMKEKTNKRVQSKTKRPKKIVKSLEKKVAKLKPADRQYITIELSYEEMMAEREREAARESYIGAQFKCETCIIGFNYSRAYHHHVNGRHAPDIGNYICPICKTIIASVESFSTHYKRHMRRFECSICKKRAPDRGRIKQHLFTAHSISVASIKCKQCDHVSHSLNNHIHHLDSHKGRFKCPDCVKTFKHRGGLKNHVIAVHELKNNFPCSVCGKVFRWKNSLKRHVEKHEAKEKTEAAHCESCDIGFKSICSYQRHMKNSLKHVTYDQRKLVQRYGSNYCRVVPRRSLISHVPRLLMISRYVCDHCSRRFIDKTKLRDHIEDKHLHKTYQCHICLKSSKNRVNLDQHIRNVHKGRPNNKMCHHCGKGFPTKVQLESHTRTHTGERPFICEYCPTTFTQKSNLYKHYRQVHLNIKSKRYPLCKKGKDDSSIALTGDSSEKTTEGSHKLVAVFRYSPDRGFVM